MLKSICSHFEISFTADQLIKKLAAMVRPSKGGSLVALSHPFVYLCRLTSVGNCRCRFSVQIHMSLSLQKFVSDVSVYNKATRNLNILILMSIHVTIQSHFDARTSNFK